MHKILRETIGSIAGIANRISLQLQRATGGTQHTLLPDVSSSTGTFEWHSSRLVFVSDGHKAILRFSRNLVVSF